MTYNENCTISIIALVSIIFFCPPVLGEDNQDAAEDYVEIGTAESSNLLGPEADLFKHVSSVYQRLAIADESIGSDSDDTDEEKVFDDDVGPAGELSPHEVWDFEEREGYIRDPLYFDSYADEEDQTDVDQ